MPPRAGLDRAAVVQAAAALADASGLEQITLADVAAQLGVRTPSLYNHVAGLPGLQRDLALLGTRELIAALTRATIGKSADDAIFAVAEAFLGFVRTHPGLYAATVRSVRLMDQPDAELVAAQTDAVQIMQAVLAAYDLRGDAALHAVRGLRSVIHGFATLEAAGAFGLPLDIDTSFRQLVQIYIAGLRAQISARSGAEMLSC
jgi:AcrR family transcriptional regulator